MSSYIAPLVAALACVSSAADANAKGFFAAVPRDGVELRYEGTFTQTDYDAFGGNEIFAFDRVVTIRTFGPETVDRGGESVDAWWVEIAVATGTATERGIETGPGGRVVCAVLVAEDDFGLADGGTPSHQPIVRGSYRIDDGPIEDLVDGVLRIDPAFTLVPDLRDDEVVETRAVSADVPAGTFDATRTVGAVTVESASVRVKTESTLTTTDEISLGPLEWAVTQERFAKESTRPRDLFELRTEIEERMRLVEIGTAFSMELDVR
ncbi:MAG: hypothetical protein AAF532_02300 [Planctomycetota bacterium]